MEHLTLKEAALAIQAQAPEKLLWTFKNVYTDTRDMKEPNGLFFALKTDKNDGHRYVEEAFWKGAAAAVVESPVKIDGNKPQLVVSDTWQALGDLGRYYRDLFDIPVVGVTGSIGKTSTKEMIALALRSSHRCHANRENENNELGVPKTLFGLDRNNEIAIVEMGMRGRGQIHRLCEIARPTIGVVTNIGISHIGILKTRDNIAAAKGELLRSLCPTDVAVINAGDEYARQLADMCNCRVVTYGFSDDADFPISEPTYTPHGETMFHVGDTPIFLCTMGRHFAENAGAACAVASILGVPLESVALNLRLFRPGNQRGDRILLQSGAVLFDDTYNSAPDSVKAGLQMVNIAAQSPNRTMAVVLGDMKELGEHSEEEHRYVGRLIDEYKVRLLVTVGTESKTIADAALLVPDSCKHHFDTAEEAAKEIGGLLLSSDVVLVKGSRDMSMELIVHSLPRKK